MLASHPAVLLAMQLDIEGWRCITSRTSDVWHVQIQSYGCLQATRGVTFEALFTRRSGCLFQDCMRVFVDVSHLPEIPSLYRAVAEVLAQLHRSPRHPLSEISTHRSEDFSILAAAQRGLC